MASQVCIKMLIFSSSGINWHYKDDTIRITVDVPGLKTVRTGIFSRKLDYNSCRLGVNFLGE
jgi:hypothetical protein